MKKFMIFFMIILYLHGIAQHPALIGKTTGPLPFLKYGLGDDRLGGAKMGFLDSNVVMKVVDSVKDDYKVQLSTYHYALRTSKNLH